MRGRDVTFGRVAVSRCIVPSNVFDGRDFVSLGTDHWMMLDQWFRSNGEILSLLFDLL